MKYRHYTKWLIIFILLIFIGYPCLISMKTVAHYIYFKYPKFYYMQVTDDELGIPVLMYHTVKSESFENDIKYLKRNKYTSLNTDQFFHYVNTGEKPAKRCVFITFDDGRKSFYKVAYPIIKEYQMHATAFILPYRADNPSGPISISTEDGYEKKFDSNSFSSWKEVREMHHSEWIDIQSHTLNQYAIPVSDEIVDFYHPGYRTGFALDRLPVTLENEFEFNPDQSWGRPVYHYASRFKGLPGYAEDSIFSRYIIQYVQENGGKAFFEKSNWRAELEILIQKYKFENEISGKFESYNEMKQNVKYCLEESKKHLESYLPDHSVQYLATPWGHNSRITIDIARSCGYKGLFITDYIGQRTCLYGDDPYNLPRLDTSDKLVFSLPGNGRISFIQRFLQKWIFYFIHPLET